MGLEHLHLFLSILFLVSILFYLYLTLIKSFDHIHPHNSFQTSLIVYPYMTLCPHFKQTKPIEANVCCL